MEKIKDLWIHISLPKKGEFVLVALGDFPEKPIEMGREKNLKETVKIAESKKQFGYVFLQIYDDKQEIIWDQEKGYIFGFSVWTWVKKPEKGEFVLVTNSPYQDNEKEIKRGKDKVELIDIGESLISNFYSSIRIYNDAKLIVWDAFLPTTLLPSEEKYDPEYFKTLIKE